MVKESVTLWWCMACLSSSHPNWPCRPRTQRAHVFQEYCPLFCGASCSPFAICQEHQPSHTTHTHMDAVCTRARLCMCLSFALMLHYTLLLFFLILPAINLRTLSFVIVALFFFSFFLCRIVCVCLLHSFTCFASRWWYHCLLDWGKKLAHVATNAQNEHITHMNILFTTCCDNNTWNVSVTSINNNKISLAGILATPLTSRF